MCLKEKRKKLWEHWRADFWKISPAAAYLLLQPCSVLHLLLQLLLQDLTLCAGLLIISRSVTLLGIQARQRDASGIAVVAKVQLLLYYRRAAQLKSRAIGQALLL